MAINYETGKVTAPVEVTSMYRLFRLTRRTNGYDIGYLCSNHHGRTNKWAMYKPIEVANAKYPITMADRVNANHGFTTLPTDPNIVVNDTSYMPTWAAEVIDIKNEWRYNPPTTVFRLSDFASAPTETSGGYSHYAHAEFTCTKTNTQPTLHFYYHDDAEIALEDLSAITSDIADIGLDNLRVVFVYLWGSGSTTHLLETVGYKNGVKKNSPTIGDLKEGYTCETTLPYLEFSTTFKGFWAATNVLASDWNSAEPSVTEAYMIRLTDCYSEVYWTYSDLPEGDYLSISAALGIGAPIVIGSDSVDVTFDIEPSSSDAYYDYSLKVIVRFRESAEGGIEEDVEQIFTGSSSEGKVTETYSVTHGSDYTPTEIRAEYTYDSSDYGSGTLYIDFINKKVSINYVDFQNIEAINEAYE